MKKKNTSKSISANTSDGYSHKSLLNELIFLGKVKNEVKIDKFSFVIKTLTEEETREILERLMRIPEEKRLICVKSMTLAKSVESINGLSFDDIARERVKDSGKKVDDASVEITKNEIILLLQSTVANKLFDSYNDLLEESRKLVGGEEIKN